MKQHKWRDFREDEHGSNQLLVHYDCVGCGAVTSIVLDTLDTPADARGPHAGLPRGRCPGGRD